MDATTKTKTLAVAFVAFLVGSVFVSGVATAHSADLAAADDAGHNVANPANVLTVGNPIRVVHFNTAGTISQVTYPENGTIDYNQTYDLTLTAIGNSTGATGVNLAWGTQYQLVAPSGTLVGATRSAYNDTEHCGQGSTAPVAYQTACGAPYSFANITFPNVKFSEGGIWLVTNATSSATVAQFVVSPHTEIAVSLSKTSVVYNPTGSFNYILTATYAANGTPVSGAVIDVFPSGSGLTNGVTTQPDGTATVLQTGTPHANVYHFFVNASIANTVTGSCASGDPVSTCSDIFGENNLTISAAPLTVNKNSTTAYTGFQNNVTFTPQFQSAQDSNSSFAFTGVQASAGTALGAGFFPNASKFNASVTFPNGTVLYMSGATRGSLAFPVSEFTVSGGSNLQCFDPNNAVWISGPGSACNVTSILAKSFGVDQDTGRIYFVPGSSLWLGGTYTFGLTISNDAAGNSEYSGSTTLVPTSPAGVNLALTDGSGNSLTAIPVLPGTGSPLGLQGQTVLLNITGESLFQHPLCESGGAPGDVGCTASPTGTEGSGGNFAENITVSGAVLPTHPTTGSASGDITYNRTTGIATISNLVTSGSGNVVFSVNWKGTTTTLTVPTSGGANITTDTADIQVGKLTNFTITVKDAFGNLVPTATIKGFNEDGSAFSPTTDPFGSGGITGNGGPTMGQGGVYNINITPASVKNMIVQATVQPPGGTATYALYRVKVVAGHDLTVNLSKTDTSAGLPTFISVNATNSTGAGVPTGTAQVYLLTAQEKTDLLANGSTSLSSVPSFRKFGNSLTAFTNSSVYGVNITAALGADVYNVYVQDAAVPSLQHDNLNSMPMLTVHNYTVTFVPATIATNWTGQTNVTVNATIKDWQGNLAPNGTQMRYSLANSTGNLTDPTVGGSYNFAALNKTGITNGVVTLTVTGRDPGVIMVEIMPASSAGTPIFTGATGALVVAGPTVTVNPTSVNILTPQVLTITAANFTGGALAGVEVRVCGISLNANFPSTAPTTLTASDRANCTAVDVTNADGTAAVNVAPNSLSPLLVYVNNVNTGVSIPVFAGTLAVSIDKTSPKTGDTVTITAAQSQGASGSAGIAVNVTRDGTFVVNQTSDSSGHVVLSNVSAGNYSIVATRSGFLPGFLNFSVGASSGNVTPPGPHFTLSNLVVPDTATVGQPVTVSADVKNDGTSSGTANMLLLVNDKVVGTFSLPDLGVGETQSVQFQPFTPSVPGTFHVVVKIGTTTVDKTITVNQQGTTTSTPTTSTTTTTTTTTTTSPTVSSSPVTSTPTSTTTTTPSPRVPGFEFVALVGAIAAALLVLRRKN